MARDIAIFEPNPSDWEWWVGYLLEQMEMEAQKRGKGSQYESMLLALRETLETRI